MNISGYKLSTVSNFDINSIINLYHCWQYHPNDHNSLSFQKVKIKIKRYQN